MVCVMGCVSTPRGRGRASAALGARPAARAARGAALGAAGAQRLRQEHGRGPKSLKKEDDTKGI